MQKWILLIARICLAAIFLKSGFDKIVGYEGTLNFMASAGLPFPALLLPPTILIELLGGLSVLLGYKTQWGAIALVVFLIPTTLVFHTNFVDRMQQIQFLKNLAIIGGLLMLIGTEPGALSLDARKKWSGRSPSTTEP